MRTTKEGAALNKDSHQVRGSTYPLTSQMTEALEQNVDASSVTGTVISPLSIHRDRRKQGQAHFKLTVKVSLSVSACGLISMYKAKASIHRENNSYHNPSTDSRPCTKFWQKQKSGVDVGRWKLPVWTFLPRGREELVQNFKKSIVNNHNQPQTTHH